MTAFCIAMGQAHFELNEKVAWYSQYVIEHLNGPSLNWFSRFEDDVEKYLGSNAQT